MYSEYDTVSQGLSAVIQNCLRLKRELEQGQIERGPNVEQDAVLAIQISSRSLADITVWLLDPRMEIEFIELYPPPPPSHEDVFPF